MAGTWSGFLATAILAVTLSVARVLSMVFFWAVPRVALLAVWLVGLSCEYESRGQGGLDCPVIVRLAYSIGILDRLFSPGCYQVGAIGWWASGVVPCAWQVESVCCGWWDC